VPPTTAVVTAKAPPRLVVLLSAKSKTLVSVPSSPSEKTLTPLSNFAATKT
jgi:hypothetical protein